MKKFFIFFLLIFYQLPIQAQKINLKPAAGINFTITERHLQEDGSARENGFMYGLDPGCYAEINLSKRFSLETGIFYSLNRGSFKRPYRLTGSIIPEEPVAKENYNLHYLKIPVSFLFKLNNNKKNQIWGFGSEVKYCFAARRKIIVQEKDLIYRNKFSVDKENGNRLGLGGSLFLGKEVYKVKRPFSFRLLLEIDFTEWRYPSDIKNELPYYYRFRGYGLSLLFSLLNRKQKNRWKS